MKHLPNRIWLAAVSAATLVVVGGAFTAMFAQIHHTWDFESVGGQRLVRVTAPSRELLTGTSSTVRLGITPTQGSIGKVKAELQGMVDGEYDSSSYSSDHADLSVSLITPGRPPVACPVNGMDALCPVGVAQGQTATLLISSAITPGWVPNSYLVDITDGAQGWTEAPLTDVASRGAWFITRAFTSLEPMPLITEKLAPGYCKSVVTTSGPRPTSTAQIAGC